MKLTSSYFILLFFFIIITTIAQPKKAQSKLDIKLDSITNVIKLHSGKMIKDHVRKVDSVNNAAYIQALEKSNILQAGNNTYYSFVFTLLAIIVAVSTLIFAINFFSTKRGFKTHIKKQQEHFDKVNNNLKSIIEAQQKEFNDVAEKHKKAIESMLSKAENVIKEVENKSPTPEQTKVIEKLKLDLDDLKFLMGNPHSMEGIQRPTSGYVEFVVYDVTCRHCGAKYYRKTNLYSKDNGITVCPRCNQFNQG